MKISIIIPIYNGSLLLNRCLDSILNQQGDFSLEIICIDDGSTDNSVQIVKDYHVTLIQQSNQGPAAARNKGIKVASGKYVAFLDADDYWKPDFLLETVTFLEANSEAIAVSVGQKHIITGNSIAIVPEFLNTDPFRMKDPIVLESFFSFWAQYFHVCTGSILMNTDVVKQTGGQRIELRITEDLEFWAYLATFGKIGFIPKILFVSDGMKVTREIGWLKKNRQRWASAPTLETWEERIAPVINKNDFESYQKARGYIAKNLSYAMILSGRSSQARKTIEAFGMNFPKDRVSRILRAGAGNTAFWYLVVLLIRLREYTRWV